MACIRYQLTNHHCNRILQKLSLQTEQKETFNLDSSMGVGNTCQFEKLEFFDTDLKLDTDVGTWHVI